MFRVGWGNFSWGDYKLKSDYEVCAMGGDEALQTEWIPHRGGGFGPPIFMVCSNPGREDDQCQVA